MENAEHAFNVVVPFEVKKLVFVLDETDGNTYTAQPYTIQRMGSGRYKLRYGSDVIGSHETFYIAEAHAGRHHRRTVVSFLQPAGKEALTPRIVYEGVPGKHAGRSRVAHVDGVRVTPGLYRIHWMGGGSSLAAIGMTAAGEWWVAPTNWITPSAPLPLHDTEGRTSWDDVKEIERIDPEDE